MRLLVLLSLGLILGASWSAGSPPRAHATTEGGGTTWGVTDEDWPPGNTVLADLTSALGRRADVVAWYVQAAADYPRGTRLGRYWEDNSERVRSVLAAGQVPMITWEFGDQRLTAGTYFPLQDIIDGRYDEYLDTWARGVRDDAPGVVYLRPFHEMNLIDYAWSTHPKNTLGNTPQQLALAWRHVVGRFRAAGADNVRWVFNVGGDLANNPLPAGAYPGDNYVDYIGSDSYGNAPPNSLALDEERIAAIANKPWLMGEVAGPAEWVQHELLPFAQRRSPSLVWFNKPPWPLTPGQDTTGAVRSMLATLPASTAPAINSGGIPAGGGFGLFVFAGGSLTDLVTSTGCRGQLAVWYAFGGGFVTYVPGTSIGAVNAPFLGLFPGRIPANTPLLGRCGTA